MDILKKYVSNTLASNGNQTWFENAEPRKVQSGMVFSKVFCGGTFPYVFGYSGILDSTFGDGSRTKCNDVCPAWKIHSLSYAVTDTCDCAEAEKSAWNILTFDGSIAKIIDGEKLVCTDPTDITAKKGQYICLKITFSGQLVPCHEESIISIYRKNDDGWQLSPKVPVPVFTGVNRPVKKKIAFIGDSITQGIGTQFNSYMHYAARTADAIGKECAFWDLGLGYARGADAATDGIWLERAKHNDIITVCFGVNDMFQGRTVEQIVCDLQKIVDELKSAGLKVIIQTVPPFDYGEEHKKMWNSVNIFIRTELAGQCDGFVDTKFLCEDGEKSPKAKFGGHPNNEGNAFWAGNLLPAIKNLL